MAGKGQKPGAPQGEQNEVELNWEQIKAMCQILCTNEEIARVMGCDADTLCNQAKRKFGMTFQEFSKKHRTEGKASLRRAQYKAAVEDKNPTMLVWMGKQHLEQTDKSDKTITINPPVIKRDIPTQIEDKSDENTMDIIATEIIDAEVIK